MGVVKLRVYSLKYTRSPINYRNLLASVTVSDKDGYALGNTNFEYEKGTPGFTSYDANIPDSIHGYGGFSLLDLNGDGASDILYMTTDSKRCARAWRASLGRRQFPIRQAQRAQGGRPERQLQHLQLRDAVVG